MNYSLINCYVQRIYRKEIYAKDYTSTVLEQNYREMFLTLRKMVLDRYLMKIFFRPWDSWQPLWRRNPNESSHSIDIDIFYSTLGTFTTITSWYVFVFKKKCLTMYKNLRLLGIILSTQHEKSLGLSWITLSKDY